MLCSVHQLTSCELNQTRGIIPVEVRLNFPQTYERIVSSDPGEELNTTDPSVPEFVAETNLEANINVPQYFALTDVAVEPKQVKRKVFDDGKGNYYNAYNFITRPDQPRSGKPPPMGPTPRPIRSDPNQIQPLHIKPQGFNKTTPHPHRKPHKEDKHKLKLEHLPPNPTKIPSTGWFDNTGKYYYGIVHEESFTEPPEYSAQQKHLLQQQQQQDASTEQGIEVPAHHPIFKSNYRDPKQAQPFIYNDGLGNFLYKSEIHYPSYRNHLYPAVTTYGAHHNEIPPATKELPAPTAIVHHSPQITTSTPIEEEIPSKPSELARQAPAEDEEYEDESSEDDDENAHNDRYEGGAPGDDDGEEEGGEEDEARDEGYESEEKSDAPSYRYQFDDDDGSSRSLESDDAFEDAWGKYGYGRGIGHGGSDTGSYESSETKQVPRRIKFYHEKMEQITTPMKQTTEAPELKKITKVVAGKLMNNNNKSNSKPKSPPKPKPTGVKSQDDEKENPESQRSSGAAASAGSDDLKYFQ